MAFSQVVKYPYEVADVLEHRHRVINSHFDSVVLEGRLVLLRPSRLHLLLERNRLADLDAFVQLDLEVTDSLFLLSQVLEYAKVILVKVCHLFHFALDIGDGCFALDGLFCSDYNPFAGLHVSFCPLSYSIVDLSNRGALRSILTWDIVLAG